MDVRSETKIPPPNYADIAGQLGELVLTLKSAGVDETTIREAVRAFQSAVANHPQ